MDGGVEGPSDDEIAAVRAQQKAESYQSMRERGRAIGGVPGAIVAGVMVALRDIYESPKRDNGSVVVDSPSEPHDADRDGLAFSAEELGGDADVSVAALERRAPVIRRRGRRR